MTPKYLILKQKLTEDILSGKYPLFSKLPTENDLASVYGASRSTIRRALSMLEEERIIEKRWGSANTVVGTGLSSGRDTVALLLPDEGEHRYSAIRDDCISLLYREGLKLRVFPTRNSLAAEREALLAILADSYSGIIAEPVKSSLPSTNLDLYRSVARRRIPLVFIYSSPDGSLPAALVTADDYSAGYMLTRHLINKGLHDIGGIFKFDDMPGIARYKGYAEALRDAGLPIPEDNVYWYSEKDIDPGEGPKTFIDRIFDVALLNEDFINQLSAGFICYNDQTAYHVIERLQSLGLSVPDDIAVTGIDDDYYATASTPEITTLSMTRSIGREAANALISQKRGGTARSIEIPWKLIARAST